MAASPRRAARRVLHCPGAGARAIIPSVTLTPPSRSPHPRVSKSRAVEEGSCLGVHTTLLFVKLPHLLKHVPDWKEVSTDEKIAVLRSDWMPVNAVSGKGWLRPEVSSGDSDPFRGESAKRNPAQETVLGGNPLFVEKSHEGGLSAIARESRGQAHAESLLA